jgi:hypothetical protein
MTTPIAELVQEAQALGLYPPPFVGFPSIARLSRDCWVSEKIDGSNASVHITDDGRMFVGSRTRWITPDNDNYGFARWAYAHQDELLMLGPGHHFGEWWGQGCQRNYGLKEKRFSLFNMSRWLDDAARPACCHVVPLLYRGPFDTTVIDQVLADLQRDGSRAAPGFMNPEGIVVYHEKAHASFKKTIGSDGHKTEKVQTHAPATTPAPKAVSMQEQHDALHATVVDLLGRFANLQTLGLALFEEVGRCCLGEEGYEERYRYVRDIADKVRA